MDKLRSLDLEQTRATTPEERARQALEAMATGIKLKRAGLRSRNPHASGDEIERLLQRWLEHNE